MTLSNTVKLEVFEAAVELIERKGSAKKMITEGQVVGYLRTERGNKEITHQVVKSVFSSYVKAKYIRYYDVNNFRFWGVTTLGWEKWNARGASPEAVESSSDEVTYVGLNQRQCPICQRVFHKNGIARHVKACEAKH